MKKILLVFGTRPEAIKMAPLVKALQRDTEHFETKVCVTAQHRQMLDQVLEVFGIVPEYDLNIMAPGQDLYDITSKVLLGLRDVFKEFAPDVVLVHGDTTTSMAAGLAAFYQQIKVGHVEAGLRTYDMLSPIDPDRPEYPEDVREQVNINIKYEGYIKRQLSQVKQFKKMEKKRIPEDIDYEDVGSLRIEAKQKLSKIRPSSIGQASRISGVSPADISVLLIYLEQMHHRR